MWALFSVIFFSVVSFFLFSKKFFLFQFFLCVCKSSARNEKSGRESGREERLNFALLGVESETA